MKKKRPPPPRIWQFFYRGWQLLSEQWPPTWLVILSALSVSLNGVAVFYVWATLGTYVRTHGTYATHACRHRCIRMHDRRPCIREHVHPYTNPFTQRIHGFVRACVSLPCRACNPFTCRSPEACTLRMHACVCAFFFDVHALHSVLVGFLVAMRVKEDCGRLLFKFSPIVCFLFTFLGTQKLTRHHVHSRRGTRLCARGFLLLMLLFSAGCAVCCW